MADGRGAIGEGSLDDLESFLDIASVHGRRVDGGRTGNSSKSVQHFKQSCARGTRNSQRAAAFRGGGKRKSPPVTLATIKF